MNGIQCSTDRRVYLSFIWLSMSWVVASPNALLELFTNMVVKLGLVKVIMSKHRGYAFINHSFHRLLDMFVDSYLLPWKWNILCDVWKQNSLAKWQASCFIIIKSINIFHSNTDAYRWHIWFSLNLIAKKKAVSMFTLSPLSELISSISTFI